MSGEHATYPNPTITEAVCDIHFRLSSTKEWKASLAGELFKHIQDEYPEMEPVVEMGLQFEFGPSGAGTKIVPQPQKTRFTHATRPLILQLTENGFSISTLSPYQGWQVMKKDALNAWDYIEEVLQPEVINRIGLRYINRIEKETVEDSLEEWLVETDYIPRGVLHSKPGFLLRTQTHLDRENMIIITLGDTDSQRVGEYGAIIFDIDRIVEQEMAVAQNTLAEELERLHTDIRNVFSSAKGQKLEMMLNRRP